MGDYWNARKFFGYFDKALELCEKYGSNAARVLEVGPRDTRFLERLVWIPTKVAIDNEVMPEIHGGHNIRADFVELPDPDPIFDLTVCLQVLEHVNDVSKFAQKLKRSCRVLIVSVPYLWPAGFCQSHCQDPVDMIKLAGWVGLEPVESAICEDRGLSRLIGAFQF